MFTFGVEASWVDKVQVNLSTSATYSHYLSSEKNLGCLGYIGYYTTHYYRVYHFPLWKSLLINQLIESNKIFFVAHLDLLCWWLEKTYSSLEWWFIQKKQKNKLHSTNPIKIIYYSLHNSKYTFAKVRSPSDERWTTYHFSRHASKWRVICESRVFRSHVACRRVSRVSGRESFGAKLQLPAYWCMASCPRCDETIALGIKTQRFGPVLSYLSQTGLGSVFDSTKNRETYRKKYPSSMLIVRSSTTSTGSRILLA